MKSTISHIAHTTVALERTNVRLTANIKLVQDTTGNLFIESISSTEGLAAAKFKAFKYSKQLPWHTNLVNFVKATNVSSIMYDVFDTSEQHVTNDLYMQYQQTYNAGIYSEESQLINENFRCFAPLYVGDVNDLPSHYVVYKVPASSQNTYDALQSDKAKLVASFDLSYINKNVLSKIEDSWLSNDLSNITINGLSLHTGHMQTISEHSIYQMLQNEQSITENDNWLTNTFKRNNMIFSNILNLEFAFTDAEVDSAFVQYIGCYVRLNEISDSVDVSTLHNTTRLTRLSTGKLKAYDPSYVLQSYYEKSETIYGSGYGQRYNDVIEFSMNMQPRTGTSLFILVNNITDFTYTFNTSTLGSTVNETKKNIVYAINEMYTGERSTIKATLLQNGNILLRTNNVNDDSVTLTLQSTTNAIRIQQPVFTKQIIDASNVNFVKPSSYSFLTNMYYSAKEFPYITFNVDNQDVHFEIDKIEKYNGQYLYTLSRTIPESISAGDVCWLTRKKFETNNVCTHFNVATLQTQFDAKNRNYDVEKFVKSLDSDIFADDYTGSLQAYQQHVPNASIYDYQDILSNELKQYKQAVETSYNIYIDSIDAVSKHSKLIQNPYNRFCENDKLAFRKTNRLNTFISRWCYGLNGLNLPHCTDVNLQFRTFANCSNQLVSQYRSEIDNTHDWFVMISGKPAYDCDALQYAYIPLTYKSFESNELDAFVFIPQHSILQYDKKTKTCRTFFKGQRYSIVDNAQYDGYRFAVVLDTITPMLDEVYAVRCIVNTHYKTFTVYVNFYIPEPILTTAERSLKYYCADASLLYNSTKIYETVKNSVNFGTDRISLNLYDTNSQKTYLGQNVGTHWLINRNDEHLAYVGRGDVNIFNIPLIDVLELGQDLTIFYGDYDTLQQTNDPFFGLAIIFKNIVEVTENHFWCKGIQVLWNSTHDVNDDDKLGNIESMNLTDNEILTQFAVQGGTLHQYDIINMYLNGYSQPQINKNVSPNMLFYKSNVAYLSKYFAFYICKYRKIVTQKGTYTRYAELSLANVQTYLSMNEVSTNVDKTVKLEVDKPNYANIIVSLNNNIERLEQQYTYLIARQHLQYRPMMHLAVQFADSNAHKRVFSQKPAEMYAFRKNITKTDSSSYDTTIVSEYPLLYFDIDKLYTYKSYTDDVILPHVVAAKEYRTFISSWVLNTEEQLQFTFKYVTQYTLYDVMQQYIKRVLKLHSIDDDTLLKFKLIAENITSKSMSKDEILQHICEQFILRQFMQIYRVRSIKTTTYAVQYAIMGLDMNITNVDDGEQLTLIISR